MGWSPSWVGELMEGIPPCPSSLSHQPYHSGLVNHPFSAGAGAASVAPMRNWADWEWPVGRAVFPVIHTRFYFAACLRKGNDTLSFFQWNMQFQLLISVTLGTTHLCRAHSAFWLLSPRGNRPPTGGWIPAAHFHRWCHPGDSGVCPHQSCTDLSPGRSVLTVTCSGGRLQWRLEVPLCWCQLQPITGFCSRTFTVFYWRVNVLSR